MEVTSRSLCCDAWQSFGWSGIFWILLVSTLEPETWLGWEGCVRNKDHGTPSVMFLLQSWLLGAWAKPGLLTPAYFKRAFCQEAACELVQPVSHIWLFETPWTVACKVPLSMGFSRPEYWSGVAFPSPGDLSDPGIKPRPPALQEGSLLLSHSESCLAPCETDAGGFSLTWFPDLSWSQQADMGHVSLWPHLPLYHLLCVLSASRPPSCLFPCLEQVRVHACVVISGGSFSPTS